MRDAVWDHLHGIVPARLAGDIDVLWFDAANATADIDKALERRLQSLVPKLKWSVKNQARMHRRNGDAPYLSVADAMVHWPESATAVAVRRTESGALEISAPLGLDDLYHLRLAPTARFAATKRAIFDARVAAKRWLVRYPGLWIDQGTPRLPARPSCGRGAHPHEGA